MFFLFTRTRNLSKWQNIDISHAKNKYNDNRGLASDENLNLTRLDQLGQTANQEIILFLEIKS
jgi:hypothetical protein